MNLEPRDPKVEVPRHEALTQRGPVTVVELVLENCAKLLPRYRTLLPLKQIYVPNLPKP